MPDNIYANAFKEVDIILKNTDINLIKKIPNKFLQFIENHMNHDYKTNINLNIPIDKQPLLKETNAILALLYRNYWANNQELLDLKLEKQKEIIKTKENEKQFSTTNTIFYKTTSSTTSDNRLITVSKENFFKKFFKKILNLIKKRK